MIATWVVGIWQRRRWGEYAPALGSGRESTARTRCSRRRSNRPGSPWRSRRRSCTTRSCRSTRETHDRRGVKIRGLWYDGGGLWRLPRDQVQPGRPAKGKWVIHREPRDRRTVLLPGPVHPPGTRCAGPGCPGGVVPAFGDTRVRELQARSRLRAEAAERRRAAAGTAGADRAAGPGQPVAAQMTKAQRVEHAREAPRPARPPLTARTIRRHAAPAEGTPGGSVVTPLRWPERARPPEEPSTPNGGAAARRRSPLPRSRRRGWGRASGNATCSCCPKTTRSREVTGRPPDEDSPVVPFLLAGPQPDRTRSEGWQQWRAARGTFTPAPRLSIAEYRRSAPGAGRCTTCTAPRPT